MSTYRILFMAAMILQAFLVSCTQVDYSGMIQSFDGMESFQRTNTSKVAFNVTIPEDTIHTVEPPQYMTVLFNRTRTEVCRYIFNLDSEGQVIPELSDTLVVSDGFYLISSVAAASDEDFEITQIENFKDDENLVMSDMYVAVPKLNTEDIISQGYIDFNPKYPYIRKTEPLYVVRPEQSSGEAIFSYRKTAEEAKKDHVVDLEYAKLTHRISFDLELGLGEGVEVSQVICAISGVPRKVQLLSGYINDKDICKVPFEMTHKGNGKYTGYVDVYGLFSNSTEDKLIVGPGVLNVIVHVSTEANGRTIKRIFYNNYNLKKDIDAANIMKLTEDGTAYIYNEEVQNLSFSLGKIFSLSKEEIVSGAGQGCEVWEGSEEDSDPSLNPGLNPEL